MLREVHALIWLPRCDKPLADLRNFSLQLAFYGTSVVTAIAGNQNAIALLSLYTRYETGAKKIKEETREDARIKAIGS